MKIFSSLLLLTVISVGFLACRKNNNTAESKADLLASGAWVHESSGVDMDKNGTIDFSLEASGVPQCRLDNVLTFRKDGTAIADEGAAKCNTADPQTSQFNWQFADNETAIVFSGNVFTQLNGKFSLRTLTKTNLSLSKDTTVSGFGNVSVLVNLKH
jgi:Tfp pilus assembly protein PilW